MGRKKKQLDPYLTSCTIINSEEIIYLNVNVKKTKSLKANTGEYLYNMMKSLKAKNRGFHCIVGATGTGT